MFSTPYYYAGHPCAVVSAAPTADGVEVAVTFPTDTDRPGAACVMTSAQFRALLAEGAAILADVEQVQANPDITLYPGLNG